jgi:hypothetical protein
VAVERRSDDAAPEMTMSRGRSFLGIVRLPRRKAVVWAIIVAVVVAATCWYFGADVWHSIVLACVLTTVGVISLVATADRDLGSTDWQGTPRANRDGARGEVAELSWSLRTSYGRVDNKAASRVRQIARHRLALHQLDLNDPADRSAVEQLIGSSAYNVLIRSERRPLLRSLLHCLDALDALDATDAFGPAQRAVQLSRRRRRASVHLPHRQRRTSEL